MHDKWKSLRGSDHGLVVVVLSRNLPTGTEEEQEAAH
jgi:hypothetical protein